MTQRITENMLKIRVDYLNRVTNNPTEPYKKDGNRYRAQIGHYHLDTTYGGGIRDVLGIGHVPKHELINRLSAYIQGIEDGRNERNEKV